VKLAYLVDKFGQLNELNTTSQSKDKLVIDFADKLRAFVGKLKNWRHKIDVGNTVMLEHTTVSMKRVLKR